MNVQEIYKLAVKMGIEADARPKQKIEKYLKRVKEKYDRMPADEKELFDTEKLYDPYDDSGIQLDNGKQIRKVVAGIDVEAEELMIARYLSNHNPKSPIDLAISHHPSGKSLSTLADVMHMQVDALEQQGIPVAIAESLMIERTGEVSRRFLPENTYKTVDAARLLDMNLISVHTPADNLAAKFMDKEIKTANPEFVGDIFKMLKQIPEYREAIKRGFGPKLFSGHEDRRVGKIIIDYAGGTEGSKKIYERLAQAGVGTIIGMHLSEEHRKEAEKAHLNVVIAGHISSDSLGMNLFLDELEKKGIEIVPCAGLIRVSRIKNKKK